MKLVLWILAFVFLALGAVGALVPVLPTTPFLLLSSACFAKSSTRFHRWFCSTKLYENNLKSFVETRGMTLRTKGKILVIATTAILISMLLVDVWLVRLILFGVIAAQYYYFFFRIKTLPDETNDDGIE